MPPTCTPTTTRSGSDGGRLPADIAFTDWMGRAAPTPSCSSAIRSIRSSPFELLPELEARHRARVRRARVLPLLLPRRLASIRSGSRRQTGSAERYRLLHRQSRPGGRGRGGRLPASTRRWGPAHLGRRPVGRRLVSLCRHHGAGPEPARLQRRGRALERPSAGPCVTSPTTTPSIRR
jgi:hypothetical protein